MESNRDKDEVTQEVDSSVGSNLVKDSSLYHSLLQLGSLHP